MIDKECNHVPKVLEVESKWEQDKVEGTYCDGAGTAPARLVYEEEIEWMEPIEPVTKTPNGDVPRT